MTAIPSIQLKAGFLLIIFSLNMFVGFACAMGLDMGFNTGHHHEENETVTHIHADGKKHRHHQATAHHHSGKDEKDNCCNDKLRQISQSDKAVAQTVKLLNPLFIISFAAVYYNINATHPSLNITPAKYFIGGHHPPIPDTRIAIQSFQI